MVTIIFTISSDFNELVSPIGSNLFETRTFALSENSERIYILLSGFSFESQETDASVQSPA
jgi:hypothetical protein